MSTNKTFKIGELSKLFNIGADSIRYYEKVGILEPIRNPNNNYRYYTIEDFNRLALIRELLGLGFSTEQIKHFIIDRNLEKTQKLLNSELDVISQKISGLQKTQHNIAIRLNMMNDIRTQYRDEKIELLQLPSRPCIMIRNKHLTNDMIDYYIIKYTKGNNEDIGTVGLCDCYTLDLANSNPESQYYRTKNMFFYSPAISEEESNYTLPEGLYLSVVYRGPLTKTKAIVPLMLEYADNNGYSVLDDPIEFCYIDDYETNDESEYFINIQIQVEK